MALIEINAADKCVGKPSTVGVIASDECATSEEETNVTNIASGDGFICAINAANGGGINTTRAEKTGSDEGATNEEESIGTQEVGENKTGETASWDGAISAVNHDGISVIHTRNDEGAAPSEGEKRIDEGAATSEAEKSEAGTQPAPPSWLTPEMFSQFMQHMQGLTQNGAHVAVKEQKRKTEKPSTTTGKRKGRPTKKAHAVDTNMDSKSPHIGKDYDDEESTASENSMRRVNWQKGRQDWSRPSKTKKEIEKVTVDTLAEAYVCMRKYGWAILRDLTSVFAPSARFTREQQNYINKSKSPIKIKLSHRLLGS
jgi:hypothetical protein